LTDFCLIFEGFFVIFDAFLGDFFNAKIERNYFFAILFCSGYCQCFFVHALSRDEAGFDIFSTDNPV